MAKLHSSSGTGTSTASGSRTASPRCAPSLAPSPGGRMSSSYIFRQLQLSGWVSRYPQRTERAHVSPAPPALSSRGCPPPKGSVSRLRPSLTETSG
eukprot:9453731-Heterocapsa_arctica.AAC.2